jgi:hypothetical protein
LKFLCSKRLSKDDCGSLIGSDGGVPPFEKQTSYPSLITLVGVNSKSFIQSRSLQFSCLNVAEERKSQQAMLLAFSLASVTEEG